MEFKDRVSGHPNRYLMTDENENKSHVILERADEPIEVGTPLNAETFNRRMIESDDHPGRYFRIVDGEMEWLNPPMVTGVEYRTTERIGGSPLYTKYINCGVLSDGTTIELPRDTTITRWSGWDSLGTVFDGNQPNPHWGVHVQFQGALYQAIFSLGTDVAAVNPTGHLQIWYTKREANV